MNRSTLTLSAALALSIIFNVMAVTRLSQEPTSRPEPSRKSIPIDPPAIPDPAVDVSTLSSDEKLDRLVREMSQLRHEVEELRRAPAVAASEGVAVKPSMPAVGSPSSLDPKVAEVLGEQEQLDTFWRELRKINGARGKIDEATYLKSVSDFTADYLGLAEPAKSRFAETVKLVAADVAVLAASYKSERDALRSSNPQDPRGNREQFEALHQRYQEQMKPFVTRINDQLDANQPRQGQFVGQTQRWILGNIAPEGLRPDGGGRWRGGFGD